MATRFIKTQRERDSAVTQEMLARQAAIEEALKNRTTTTTHTERVIVERQVGSAATAEEKPKDVFEIEEDAGFVPEAKIEESAVKMGAIETTTGDFDTEKTKRLKEMKKKKAARLL